MILRFAAILPLLVSHLCAEPEIKPRPASAPPAFQPGMVPPDGWTKLIETRDPGSKDEAWAKFDLDDSGWKEMGLPVHFEEAGLPGFDGVVWFRKTINLPESAAGKEAILSLGAIDDMDVTWVNGKRVGGHEVPGKHFELRRYPVPAGLLKAGRNVLAVRVMDHGWGGGICGQRPQPERMFLRIADHSIKLNGAWKYRAGASAKALTGKLDPQQGDREKVVPPFASGFAFSQNDVVVFTGGTDMVNRSRHGYLESLLTLAGKKQTVHFRNMAWQADTVYVQQRPLNFESHLEGLRRVGASIIVAEFGQMEALDGREKIPAFIAAYEKLLDQYAQRTNRIVLLTPRPFGRPSNNPHLPDLTKHNAVVAEYSKAIQALAKRRGYPCVILPPAPTRDGVHLTEAGFQATAFHITKQLLRETPVSPGEIDATGAFANPEIETMRRSIIRKNQLWHQHWRPTNWSFAYGDRQHVPSSHDHRPGHPRWLPAEIDAIIPMIETQEKAIQQQKGAAAK